MLDKYNELAPLQNPPRPLLQYSDVASYSWLGDFDLLKYSCTNIMQKPWTVPANHEVANKYTRGDSPPQCGGLQAWRMGQAWGPANSVSCECSKRSPPCSRVTLSPCRASTCQCSPLHSYFCHLSFKRILGAWAFHARWSSFSWRTVRWQWGSSWQGWSHTGWGT